jgi:hypothetical protein
MIASSSCENRLRGLMEVSGTCIEIFRGGLSISFTVRERSIQIVHIKYPHLWAGGRVFGANHSQMNLLFIALVVCWEDYRVGPNVRKEKKEKK